MEVCADLRRYAAAGVTQLRVGGDVSSPAESIAWLEEFGRLVLAEGWAAFAQDAQPPALTQ
jgi:hypothetical protein